jgi:hypothetical protein
MAKAATALDAAEFERVKALPSGTRLSTNEAAVLCGKSTKTMVRMRAEGRGPDCAKDGQGRTHPYGYLREDCERWMQRGHKLWGFQTQSGLLTVPVTSLGEDVEIGTLEELLTEGEWLSAEHMQNAWQLLHDEQEASAEAVRVAIAHQDRKDINKSLGIDRT